MAGERITEEKIEALRRRIGIPMRERAKPFNTEAHYDTIRHFAHGYGDDNPLFCDPAYAAQSPWGGLFAPPMYCWTLAENDAPSYTAEQAEIMRGDPLRGIHQYHSVSDWEFRSPVRPGDGLTCRQALEEVQLKQSAYALNTAHLRSIQTFKRGDQPIAHHRTLFIHAERDTASKTGKERRIELAHYTDEDRARFDALSAAYSRRGANTRRFEEVEVGEQAGPLLKGPLLVSDVIIQHIGRGPGHYGIGALDMAYRQRQRMPRFYDLNANGWWDVAQRCHWDDEHARSVGAAAAYDYGVMRLWWFGQLMTDWGGDGAWLHRLLCQFRGFNYIGDATEIVGTVTSKEALDKTTGAVDFEITGTNQRGQAATAGTARVLLPRAGYPRARTPDEIGL